jgi:hypothetical protein
VSLPNLSRGASIAIPGSAVQRAGLLDKDAATSHGRGVPLPIARKIVFVARFLIVGGGEKASALAEALEPDGHALSVIEDAERLGPLLAALEHVAIVCWLTGVSPERFLLGAIDSSMRGFVYEPGEWELTALETAASNSIPAVAIGVVSAEDPGSWLAKAHRAIEHVLSGRYADPYT